MRGQPGKPLSHGWTKATGGPGYPQGNKNSPNVFQDMVQDVLEGLPVTVYIDYIYWTNEDEVTHLDILDQIVTCLTAARLEIGLLKCEIETTCF